MARGVQAIRVGGTTLAELRGLTPALRGGIRLWAKLEWENPGGSVKDRPAWRIVKEALAAGALTQDMILLDATSGNTGIAYGWICQRLKLRLKLAVPANINRKRRSILESWGADLAFTDPLEGSDGAIREARRLSAARPDLYFYADQYSNPLNWKAHFEATAPEIFAQTSGAVTHFVAGLGTSGTFMGTGRRLLELKPEVRLLSVEPDSPLHGLEGLKHMATSIVPPIYDPSLAHEKLSVSTAEALEAARLLAREAGLGVGPSGGANLAGALRLADRLAQEGRGGAIVTVFPDSEERYVEDRFWDLRRP